jgi:hypothetical protein
VQFEERGLVTARFKHDTEARDYEWHRTRQRMLRAIEDHYGRDFPNAMMRIRAWIETEESWHKDSNHPDGWEGWPHDRRPIALYLRVTVA